MRAPKIKPIKLLVKPLNIPKIITKDLGYYMLMGYNYERDTIGNLKKDLAKYCNKVYFYGNE
jgi:adenosyl cobinamide kinase/adenosyl cobinamide phosphate guanylyltransferase